MPVRRDVPVTAFEHPLWSLGFRPFFLLASFFAAIVVPLWVAILHGETHLASHMAPSWWHAHEMIFGYTTAVLAGFLFTAASNWTKRDTAVGARLAAVAALWIAARGANAVSLHLGQVPALIVDVAFLVSAATAIALPLASAKSQRNYVFPLALVGLALCDVVIHLAEIMPTSMVLRAWPVALDWIVLVMLLFAGRVVPMFTGNASSGLVVRNHDLRDRLGLASLWLLLIADATVAGSMAAGCALVAGLVNLVRLWGWGGSTCMRRPILWALHLGWLWLCVGLMLKGLAGLQVFLSASLATHVITVGGIGTLTMAMMSRVALGHTGRPLKVASSIAAAYALVSIAALVRVVGPALWPRLLSDWLIASAGLWCVAFAIFFGHHLPMLIKPRADAGRGQRNQRLAVMN